MKKHIKFLGFEYSRVGIISILSFLNKSIYTRVGNIYSFFGYFIVDLDKKIN